MKKTKILLQSIILLFLVSFSFNANANASTEVFQFGPVYFDSGTNNSANYKFTLFEEAVSPSFLPNWGSNFPENKAFTVDSDVSSPIFYQHVVKYYGDAMIFTLPQDVVSSLNCYTTTLPTLPCTQQYAGLTITKTDGYSNPIDDPKYLGTQDWANSLGVAGSSDFILEDFLDANQNTKNIALLPLFDNYMANNLGHYLLEFTYTNMFGSFTEEMYFEYGTPYAPTFNFAEANTDGWFSMQEVPTNTSFGNPFISCQNNSLLNLTNVSPPLRIIVERFDNTTTNSDGIVVDITFNNWSSAHNVNLSLWASGSLNCSTYPIACTGYPVPYPHNSYASLWNRWAGLSPLLLQYLDVPGSSYDGLSAVYYDNQDDIYKVTVEYTTTCGAESSEMWFTPTSPTCKRGIEEEYESISTNIYPNPSSDLLNIEFITIEKNPIITLYSITGEKVYEQTFSNNSTKVNNKIDISTLASGIYYLNLTSITGTEIHKIIKK